MPVKAENVLGEAFAASDIVSDYLTTNRTFYGAAVVGFLKQTCGEISMFLVDSDGSDAALQTSCVNLQTRNSTAQKLWPQIRRSQRQ